MSRHQKRFKDKHQYMENDFNDSIGRYYSKRHISEDDDDDESPNRQMHFYDEESRENSYRHSKDRRHNAQRAKSDKDYPEEQHRRVKSNDSYGSISRQERSSNYSSKDARRHRYEDKEKNEASDRSVSQNTVKTTNKDVSAEPPAKKNKVENLTLMTGGAYIPPAKLKMMQEKITDKSSADFQRIAWEALKKSIIGLTNKINISNISDIVRELFKENLIRGRGVLTRAVMQAQAASPTFTHVYAALVAIINTKFPEVSELILKRVIIQFKRGFRRNDKQACLSSTRFIAHLLNQQVAHEVVVLEILTLLLEKPTDDSVEVAISLLKECGMKLTELSPKGILAIFERLRNILHEGNLDKRVQYMIEVMFAIRKDKFKDHTDVIKELDLVEEDDKYTHLITLEEAVDTQDNLNVFKYDPEYEVNEEKYKSIIKEILGDSSGSEESEHSEGDSDSEDEEDNEEKANENQQIIDQTETNLVSLRRNIYLTIQSSLDFEECAHKLLKMELKPGQITEMCYMILDCCAQQRTYEKFYGLLAQRFCQLNKIYMEPFMEIFKNSYETIHRLETNKLRNVAKFFAHLLYTDAIPWLVLSNIRLNEEDTTSSSRIFIKILFQELCEYMGLPKLNERVKDVTLQEAFDGLFPRDNPHNTRFAINFFTSIGLGGLTDELREHLKSMPKNPIVPNAVEPTDNSPSDDSSQESGPSSVEESAESEEDSDAQRKKKQGKKAKLPKSSKSHSKKQSEMDYIASKSSKKLKKKKKKRKKSRHKSEKS